jgi:hypothetical protein
MTLYYTDERKYLIRTDNPITDLREDKEGGQFVHVTGTIFGITIRPSKRWTSFCNKLFREMRATGVRLEDISCAPNRSLAFINDLPGCKRLSVEGGEGVELSVLSENTDLEDLQIESSVHLENEFDLTRLRKLRRCFIPYIPALTSFSKCSKLVCLGLNGGQLEGTLDLRSLSALQEFICANVRKLRGVLFNSQVRLRSLELLYMKDFESLEPQTAVTQELLNVQLNKVPRLKFEWLRQAEKIECIALRLGEIPTINFLRGLKNLQVLDLFGSKVKDGDLSFRDSLKGELDSTLWSSK